MNYYKEKEGRGRGAQEDNPQNKNPKEKPPEDKRKRTKEIPRNRARANNNCIFKKIYGSVSQIQARTKDVARER